MLYKAGEGYPSTFHILENRFSVFARIFYRDNKFQALIFNHALSSLKEPETSGFHPNLVVVCAKVPSLPDLRAKVMSLDALDEYALRVQTSYC